METPPKLETVRINVFVPKAMVDVSKRYAMATGRTLSDLVRQALREYLVHLRNDAPPEEFVAGAGADKQE